MCVCPCIPVPCVCMHCSMCAVCICAQVHLCAQNRQVCLKVIETVCAWCAQCVRMFLVQCARSLSCPTHLHIHPPSYMQSRQGGRSLTNSIRIRLVPLITMRTAIAPLIDPFCPILMPCLILSSVRALFLVMTRVFKTFGSRVQLPREHCDSQCKTQFVKSL
jgi:hypothetical protein